MITTPITVGTRMKCNLAFGIDVAGEVIALANDWLIVEADNAFYKVERATFRDQDDDLWTVVEAETTRWFNIYDDRTIGTTAHHTFEEAVARPRYNKTRIGVLQRVTQGNRTISAKVHSTTPLRRNSVNRTGFNPYV